MLNHKATERKPCFDRPRDPQTANSISRRRATWKLCETENCEDLRRAR